jgi:hypothetical protein
MVNLGILLGYKEQYEQADALLRTALARRREVLGSLHPQTLDSCFELGMSLHTQGQHGDAEPLLRGARRTSAPRSPRAGTSWCATRKSRSATSCSPARESRHRAAEETVPFVKQHARFTGTQSP